MALNASSQTLVTPLHERSAFLDAQSVRRRNEISYETTVAVQELPSAHVAWEATAESVLVTTTDMDVLAEWLFVMGGRTSSLELPSGQTAWTLATTTWSDSPKFPPVPVFVTVVQPSHEPVIWEIEDAKRNPRPAAVQVSA